MQTPNQILMLQKLTRENAARELIAALPFPPVTLRLCELSPNQSNPLALASAIQTDPELELRLIELARFSSGAVEPIESLSDAIRVLGADVIRSVSLGLTAFASQASSHSGKRVQNGRKFITLQQVLEHSVGCATIGARLAARFVEGERHRCFAAGFLHDIGRVLLLQHWGKYLVEAFAIATIKKIPVTEAEALVFGCNHLELGQLWCRTVNLDAFLEDIVSCHHPEISEFPAADQTQQKILTVVHLADALCEAHDLSGGDGAESFQSPFSLKCTIDASEEKGEIEAVKKNLDTIGKLFGIAPVRSGNVSRAYRGSAQGEWGATSKPTKGTSGKGRVIPFPGRGTSQQGRKTETRDKKLTILVVEDHGSLCEMLSLYFMRHGYHVRTAMDGQSALEILSNEEIHLMLLDLMLPRLDGFAVLQHIREHREQKAPYVIVVSAGASAKDRNRVLELGADEYMPKPFHLIRLLERIHNVERYLLG